jgi:hypothetical protein
MDTEEVLGVLLHYCCLIAPMVGVWYSLYHVVVDGIYGYIYLPGIDVAIIHSWSLFCILGFFWVTYYMLSYLMPLLRMIAALSLTIFSIQAYDFLWSAFSQAVRGVGFSWGALIASFILLVLLERMDNKHNFISVPRLFTTKHLFLLIGVAILFLSFKGLVDTGFFLAMTLYEQGLGPDPNIGNFYWFVGKTFCFYIVIPLVKLKKLRAPLRLDPRVLIW